MTLTLSDKPLTEPEIEQVHAIVSDWDVVRVLGTWPWPADPAFTRKRMTETLPDGALTCAAFEGDNLCGTGGLMPKGFKSQDEDRAFWGLMISRDHRRKGVAMAIAGNLFDRFFATSDAPVYAQVWGDNPASHALHRKLGFVEIERKTAFHPARKEDVEDVTYVLTRDAWEART